MLSPDVQEKAGKAIRRGILTAIAIPFVVGAALLVFRWCGYAIVVNPSPSIAVGFYLVKYNDRTPVRNGYVAFDADSQEGQYGYRMGWIRPEAPYLKRVYGLAGDSVCVTDLTVSVNGIRLGAVKQADRQGRALPHAIQGCIVVPEGRFFPMGDGAENSYDGRYYGTVSVSMVRGRIAPLWVFK